METTGVKPLPHKLAVDPAKQVLQDRVSVKMELEKDETQALLTDVNHAYNTEINDILLTALGWTISAWTSDPLVAFHLEGHGREEIMEDIDISRTVGWFTSSYPVVLDMSGLEETEQKIIHVKDSLRRIPARGIGYGIIRYLVPEEGRDGLTFSLEPEIGFNYLGQFLQEGSLSSEAAVFQASDKPMGTTVSPHWPSEHTLEIHGMIVSGQLKLAFDYNKFEFEPGVIESLVETYKTNLLEIIDFCSGRESSRKTAGDFAADDLDEEEMEDLFDELED